MREVVGEQIGLLTYPERFAVARPLRLAKDRFKEQLKGKSSPVREARAYLKEAVNSVFLTHAFVGTAESGLPAVVVLRVTLKAGAQWDSERFAFLDSTIPYQCLIEVLVPDAGQGTVSAFTVTGRKKLERNAQGEWQVRARAHTYYRSKVSETFSADSAVGAEATPELFHDTVIKTLLPSNYRELTEDNFVETSIPDAANTSGAVDSEAGMEQGPPTLSVEQLEATLKRRDELEARIKKLNGQRSREKQPARKLELSRTIRRLNEELKALPL